MNTMTRSVPVFLIDDNRLLRDGLSAMLSAQGLSVVATARSGQEALREVARVRPQLVLLDSALGDRDSPRFVQEVRQAFPDIKVIVMGLLPECLIHQNILHTEYAAVDRASRPPIPRAPRNRLE